MTDPYEISGYEAGTSGKGEIAVSENQTAEAMAAIFILDPDGGWDHDPGWGDHIAKSLRKSVALGFVEHGVSFEIDHWRLTDDGIAMRAKLDHGDV